MEDISAVQAFTGFGLKIRLAHFNAGPADIVNEAFTKKEGGRHPCGRGLGQGCLNRRQEEKNQPDHQYQSDDRPPE
jgi:hypothetical protein